MKALVVIVVLLVVCVVLFVVGAFSPQTSRKLQRRVDRLSEVGEAKGDRDAGKLGDLTRDGLEKARAAADASARGGRAVHEKLSPDE